MPASLETQYYKLPIYQNSDVIDYIPTFNDGMQKIDAALRNNSVIGNGNQTAIESLQALTETQGGDINNINNSINTINSQISIINNDINLLKNPTFKNYDWVASPGMIANIPFGGSTKAALSSIVLEGAHNIALLTLGGRYISYSNLIKTTFNDIQYLQYATTNQNPFPNLTNGEVLFRLSNITGVQTTTSGSRAVSMSYVAFRKIADTTELWILDIAANTSNPSDTTMTYNGTINAIY